MSQATENPAETAVATPPHPVHTALADDVRSEITKIETIVGQCQLALAGATDEFSRGIALARGMRLLRAAFTPEIMADVLELCGSPLGFSADRPNDKAGPYRPEEIRDAVIQAQLRGARLVGHEFTIISRRAYLNREYFERRLRELEGFADLDLQAGVPVFAQAGGALVPVIASWTYHGQPYRLERTLRKGSDGTADDRRVPVRVNNGQGTDAAVGKATRKVLAQILGRLLGSKISEEPDPDTLDGEVVGDVLAQEMAPVDAPAAEAENQDADAGGGFDYADFMAEFEAKIQTAVEAASVVNCGKARAWALQHGPLPPDVTAAIERVHFDAVAEIRRNRGANSNPRN